MYRQERKRKKMRRTKKDLEFEVSQLSKRLGKNIMIQAYRPDRVKLYKVSVESKTHKNCAESNGELTQYLPLGEAYESVKSMNRVLQFKKLHGES